MSDTPITDYAAHGFVEQHGKDIWDKECVDAEVARSLERDRGALIVALRPMLAYMESSAKAGRIPEDDVDIVKARALLARLEKE